MRLKKLGSSSKIESAQILFFANKPSKSISLTSNLVVLFEGKADWLLRPIACV